MTEHEEALAAILWHYVEQIRQSPPEDRAETVGLTREELAELAGLLATARAVHLALERPARDDLRTAIRARVLGLAEAEGRRVRRRPWITARTWSLAGAAGALALALFVATRATLPMGLPREVPGRVVAISCREALRRMDAMVHGGLPAEEALSYWYHFVRCGPCLKQLREHEAGRVTTPPFLRLAADRAWMQE